MSLKARARSIIAPDCPPAHQAILLLLPTPFPYSGSLCAVHKTAISQGRAGAGGLGVASLASI